MDNCHCCDTGKFLGGADKKSTGEIWEVCGRLDSKSAASGVDCSGWRVIELIGLGLVVIL